MDTSQWVKKKNCHNFCIKITGEIELYESYKFSRKTMFCT